MKKKLLTLLCALALTVSLVPCAQALEGEGTRAAQVLSSLGLVSGTGRGYAAADDATQEQAAALLVRMLGAEKAANADRRWCGWKSIPTWARSAVNYCAYHALLSPEEYAPNGALDAEVWCAMLLRALGYGGELGVSPARTAQRIGLVPRALSGSLTRGDLFETALGALTYPTADGHTLLGVLLDRKLCSVGAADTLGLRGERLTARQTADRYLSAVLRLELYNDEAMQAAEEERTSSSNASAFLISPDGLAVTNYHSIDGAVYGTATLVTGEVFAIESVLYYDADIDIAVIRISRANTLGETAARFNSIVLAGTDEVRVGDVVYAIGNPLGLGLAMSQGVVSATAHDADLSTLPCIVSDATISRGSSGGALLNEYGHAIAVTTGAYTYGNNMYLGVPVDPAMTADLTGEGMTLREVGNAVLAAREAAEEAARREAEATEGSPSGEDTHAGHAEGPQE